MTAILTIVLCRCLDTSLVRACPHQKIAGVETTMTSKFADTGREIADLKTQIAEMVIGVKTLSHKCLTNEESIQKFKSSQHLDMPPHHRVHKLRRG